MANPYKKDADRKKVAPGGNPKPHEVEEVEEVVVTPVIPEAKEDNPLAGMIKTKETGKSYAFYLSTEAAEKLEALAKQNKCSKSKALDVLLRNL